MITDQQTNKVYFSKLLETDKRFKNTFSEVYAILKDKSIQYAFLPHTKDIWARDYMPVQVSKNKFVEFRYDPDYLQGNSENEESRELKTYPDMVCDAIGKKTIKSDIILDGGNVIKSDNAVIMADKVVWENERRYTEKQLVEALKNLFEVEKVVLIPWDEECEYGHADGMLRFIDKDKVLISGFYETVDKAFKEDLLWCLKQEGIAWEWLRCANKESERNISYINFLQTKDLIIIPKLNRKEDKVAFEEISRHFPEYATDKNIFMADARDIEKYGGAFNCISWSILE